MVTRDRYGKGIGRVVRNGGGERGRSGKGREKRFMMVWYVSMYGNLYGRGSGDWEAAHTIRFGLYNI